MSRAAAFEFLCGCLSCDASSDSRDALLRAARGGSFAWETFVGIACDTLVAPAVLDAVRRKNILEALPRDVVDFFDGVAVLNRQRNDQLLTEANELAATLNGVGVVPVFLKGAAHLLSRQYSDPAHRVMVDLDVLVPADRLSDCAARLRANGYEALTDADLSGHHHHSPLGRPGSIVAVELHHEPLDIPYRRLLPAAAVLADAVVLERGTAKLAVSSGQSRLIHAVAHAQLANHAYLYGHLALRELLDFARLHEAFARDIDWSEMVGRFADCRAATALEFHLFAAERLLAVPIGRRIQISARTRALYRRALWQVGHPTWSRVSTRLLRPCLLLRRSLSNAVLRRRLVRSLGDRTWYRRQWHMFRR
jgi:Uncharacterised nucleotidyltransferase